MYLHFPYLAAVIELRRRERGRVVGEESSHCSSLIVGKCEEIAESSTAKDNLLAGSLGIVDSRPGVNLCGTDSSEETAGDRETRVESSSSGRSLPCKDDLAQVHIS